MFWVSAVLMVLVLALFGWSYLRPGTLRRLSEKQWIIAGGIAMPLPVLIGLSGLSLVLGEQILPVAGAPRIEVIASRWNWEFRYPATGQASVDILHMPAGVPVELTVTSNDVIHSFWIPRLGGKIDAIPGRANTIRLMADRPGTYRGICAEYCGTGHDSMHFTAIAHHADEYEAAVGVGR